MPKRKKKKQSADFLCVWRISLRLKRVSEFSYGKVEKKKKHFSFLKVKKNGGKMWNICRPSRKRFGKMAGFQVPNIFNYTITVCYYLLCYFLAESTWRWPLGNTQCCVCVCVDRVVMATSTRRTKESEKLETPASFFFRFFEKGCTWCCCCIPTSSFWRRSSCDYDDYHPDLTIHYVI